MTLTAQEPNPYAKAKVGDYAVYKTPPSSAGITMDGVLTQTVTATDGKEVTITVTGKVNNQDVPSRPPTRST